MRISAKVNAADLIEARALLSGSSSLKCFLLRPSVLACFGFFVWFAVQALLDRNWVQVGFVIVVIAIALLLLRIHLVHRERRVDLKDLNATLPDWITILAEGLHLEESDQATHFLPWTRFMGYKEGERMIWLKGGSDGWAVIMLPISRLSEAERNEIRHRLEISLTHLPDEMVAK